MNTRAFTLVLADDGPLPSGGHIVLTLTHARQAAEEAWLTAVTDPAAAPPGNTHIGHALRFFSTDPFAAPYITEHCPLTPARPNISIGPSGDDNIGVDDCVQTWWLGHAASANTLRRTGAALAPESTSTVAVESVIIDDTSSPTVAYLTYDLQRADEQPIAYGQATIRATETMRSEDEHWKLASRSGFEILSADTTCLND